MGNLKMRRCKTLQQLRTDFKKIHSVVSDDTKFMAEALLFIAEKLSKARMKREPTEYQKTVGKFMAGGKGIKEAHKLAKKALNSEKEVKP